MRQTAMRAKMQSARPVAPLASPVIGTPPAISYNLARRTPAVPGNLTIGRVDDPSEQAADQVADTVMGQPQPAATTAAVQIRPAAPLPGPIRPTSPAPPELGLGPGRPMPAAVRGFFEPRFGQDLSSVRIHADAAAGQSARSIDARAYAIGNNIVFGNGEYRPDSESGKHLIAHELAHVGQAGTGTGNNQVVRRQPAGRTSDLAVINNEIQMLSMMPGKMPVQVIRLAQLQQQRVMLLAHGAGAPTAQTKPKPTSPTPAPIERVEPSQIGESDEQSLAVYIDNHPAWDTWKGGSGSIEMYQEIEANLSGQKEWLFYSSTEFKTWYFYGWRGLAKLDQPTAALQYVASILIPNRGKRSKFFSDIQLPLPRGNIGKTADLLDEARRGGNFDDSLGYIENLGVAVALDRAQITENYDQVDLDLMFRGRKIDNSHDLQTFERFTVDGIELSPAEMDVFIRQELAAKTEFPPGSQDYTWIGADPIAGVFPNSPSWAKGGIPKKSRGGIFSITQRLADGRIIKRETWHRVDPNGDTDRGNRALRLSSTLQMIPPGMPASDSGGMQQYGTWAAGRVTSGPRSTSRANATPAKLSTPVKGLPRVEPPKVKAPTTPKAGALGSGAIVTRIRPMNGRINVGGGLEPGTEFTTNLNPIKANSGGPTKGIPNHVKAGFEDIADVFEHGSATSIISNRLLYADVNWSKAANGAAKVMSTGGTFSLNVWTRTPAEGHAIAKAFRDAGFRDVIVIGEGSGTIISGKR